MCFSFLHEKYVSPADRHKDQYPLRCFGHHQHGGGVEFALAPKWTLDISGNWNGWNFKDNMKWKHFLIQPEARYWLCEKFNGHFFGLHVHGGEFNVGNVCTPFGLLGDCRDSRHMGWYYGAGISYGYQWLIGTRWNLELSAGIGYVGADYTAYKAPVCGPRIGPGHQMHSETAALNFILSFEE